MTPPEVHRLSASVGSSNLQCQNFKVCNIRVSGTGFWQTCSTHDGIHKLQNWNKTHLSKYMSIRGREKGKEEGNGQCSGLKCPHALCIHWNLLGLKFDSGGGDIQGFWAPSPTFLATGAKGATLITEVATGTRDAIYRSWPVLALHMKYSYHWFLPFRPTSGHNLSGEEMHFHKHDHGKIQTSQKAASHFVLFFVVVIMYNFYSDCADMA